jgi:hypothetical protein
MGGEIAENTASSNPFGHIDFFPAGFGHAFKYDGPIVEVGDAVADQQDLDHVSIRVGEALSIARIPPPRR